MYRSEGFPRRWRFHKVLLEGVSAVDTTLVNTGLTWWLFANMVENDGASTWDELFIFSADSPLSGHWTPHRRNPVVSDVRRARPAGRIFERNGRLYRPSQDCSKWYGYGVRVNEIVVLNESEYEEREVDFLKPNWDKQVRGVHTLSHVGATHDDRCLHAEIQLR